MIVETAAAVIGARAGSLFLIDPATDELIFQVAFGSRAEPMTEKARRALLEIVPSARPSE